MDEPLPRPEQHQTELEHMKEVLAWASENVWSISHSASGLWRVSFSSGVHDTLYQALHAAWEHREKGEK